MNGRFRTARLVLGLSLGMCLTVAAAMAQRPPGGGGGGGGSSQTQNRLAMLTATLKLDETQKKQAETVLDAGFKNAAPLRTALAAARAPIGSALQSGRDQAEIDQAVSTYAAQVTAMAGAEMQALAKIMRTLTPGQQADANALQTAVSLMRSAFIGKKWDTLPDVRFY